MERGSRPLRLTTLTSLTLLLAGGLTLHPMRGTYAPSLVIVYAMVFVGAMAIALCCERRELAVDFDLATLVAIPPLFFSALLAWDPGLLYPTTTTGAAAIALRALLMVALLVSALLFAATLLPRRAWVERAIGGGAIATTALLLGAQLLVPVLSPAPAIDAYVACTIGADAFLQGVNPYQVVYPDIYGGRFDTVPGCNYWPGIWLFIVPARALLGDIRYAFWVTGAAFALLVALIARRAGAARPLPAQLALLWASFPVGFFVLEQGWNDTILLALTAAVLLAVLAGRQMIAGVIAGCLFSVKLYALPLAPVLLIYLVRERGWRRAALVTGIAAAVFAIICAPLVGRDVGSFLDLTVGVKLVASKPRTDAFSLVALAIDLGRVQFANWHFLLFGALALAGYAFALWRTRAATLAQALLPVICYFGLVLLLGKVAFCNHYAFLSGLVLLLLAVSPEPSADLNSG